MNRLRERGSVVLLVLALAAVFVGAALLTVDVTLFLAGRAQAQVAADAAALAAAPLTFSSDDALEAAASIAAANGARLTRCDCDRNATWARRTVVTTVEIPLRLTVLPDISASATARATFDPTRLHR